MLLKTDHIYRTNRIVLKNEYGVTYWNFLLFYKDKSVINVSSTDSGENIKKWFTKGADHIGEGNYSINGNHIEFEITSETGTIQYQGEIFNTKLQLNSINRTNNNKETSEYFLY